MIEATRVAEVGATLGEGPVWVAGDGATQGALWFTDIKAPQVLRFVPETGQLTRWDAPAQVGWVLPSAEGGFIAGLQTGLARFDPASGHFDPLGPIEPEMAGNRLNDATVDARGRLWFGSMDDVEDQPTGHIYRADAGGIARVVSDICITNGPAVSPDGTLLYYNNTLDSTVHVARIAEDGSLSDNRIFAHIDEGYADGPVIDAEGGVWVSVFGGWGVRHYAPDGHLIETVSLPVANVTKIAFGGPDLATAYVTTARKGLSEDELAGQPLAGDLFAFDPDVKGQAGHRVASFAMTRHY